MKYTSNVRKFNRFYTSYVGALNQKYFDSDYSLADVRVLYEISESNDITAQRIANELNLDKGYLSRIIKKFINDEIIEKKAFYKDKRAHILVLTLKGEILLKSLNKIVDKQIDEKIKDFSELEKKTLVDSMLTIEHMLSEKNKLSSDDIIYRSVIKPGDIGYVIYLHGIIYGQESIFSDEFESYVIKTFYQFMENFSPEYDRLFMAEYNGKIIGTIAIVHNSEKEAQLRWFLLDPSFRGLGIGKKLLKDALDFCKEKNFNNVFLLTTDLQKQAVAMYKQAGFKLTKSVKVSQWGATFTDERYDLNIVE